MKNKKYLNLIIIILVIFLGVYFFISFKSPIKEECLEITNNEIYEKGIIDFLKKSECPLEKAGSVDSINSVSDYLICKSIVEDDINICRELIDSIPEVGYEKMLYIPETHFNLCRNFNLFFANFINRIEKEKSCSKEIIDYCLLFMEGEDEEKERLCRDFCESYINRDKDFCSNPPKTNVNSLNQDECLALFTADKKYCNELEGISRKQCLAVVQYLLAIRGNDRERCSLINTEPFLNPETSIYSEVPNFKMICNLFFEKNNESCKKELDLFIESYCEKSSKH